MPPQNQEINQALKEFETKKGEENPIPTMMTNQASTKQVEGISFDTEKEVESYKDAKLYNENATLGMVKLVMKISGGTIKDQKKAEWILLGLVAVMLGVSLYIIFGKSSSNDAYLLEQKKLYPPGSSALR